MSELSLNSIGHYLIKKCLVQRPERSVYLADHKDTNESVILKVLNPSLMQGWKDLELFEREVRILKNLNHPGIPRCLDSFQFQTDNENLQVLVENYIPGINWAEKLKDEPIPDEQELKKTALDLLDILAYLNSHHPPLIHRDIKPSNLLWGEDKQAYLLDFGAVSDQRQTQGSSTVVGTFGYMSPEQTMGKALPASDRYSLGATLLHLLSHTPPEQWPRHGFEMLWNFQHGIKEPWLSFIQGLTKVSPQDRMSLQEAQIQLEQTNQIKPWKRINLYKQTMIIREKPKSVSIYMPEKPLKPYLVVGLTGLAGLISSASSISWWIWWLILAGLIWHVLRYQPRIYLGSRWFFQSGKLPRQTKNIENIQIVHNPYRQGLRLEYRKHAELKHLFMPLKLSQEELEKTRIYLNRYSRQFRVPL